MYEPVGRNVLTEEVVKQIQDSILAETIRPGDQLPPQRELASSLGVSTAVLRESLKILEARGLLEIKAGVGTFVASLTPELIARLLSVQLRLQGVGFDQLYDVRNLLEVESAGLAATKAGPADLALMEKALAKYVSNTEDHEARNDADFSFHLAIAEATGNPIFPVMNITLMEIMLENRRAILLRLPDTHAKTSEAHRRILDCIRGGDVVGAREAMRVHLEDSRQHSAAATEKSDAKSGKRSND